MMIRFLSCLILFQCAVCTAQTELLNTNFTNGIPTNYSQLNLDNQAPAVGLEPFAAGWITTLDPENIQDTVAAATSYFTTADTANRWLITPALSLGSYGNYLSWEAKSHDPSFPDDYLVLVSTTTNDPAAFTDTIGNVNGENFEWTCRTVNLSNHGYNDSTIYIAFVLRSFDKYILYLDDIKVLKDDPVAVENHVLSNLEVYPNPTAQWLTIKSKEAIQSVTVLDLSGKIILESNSPVLDLQNLISGTYILELVSNGNISRKKIQKI
ncbi:MAG: hypothetical protein RLZZ65_1160 [Bacteroidota bacterium]|jgi:hypothetical protein